MFIIKLDQRLRFELIVDVVDDFSRHLLDRDDKIDEAGSDGVQRHAVVLGRTGGLHQRQAARLLDFSDAQRTIGPGAGQDHGDGPLLQIIL